MKTLANIAAASLTLSAAPALAHPGHGGGEGTVLHTLDHLAAAAPAAVLLAVAFILAAALGRRMSE